MQLKLASSDLACLSVAAADQSFSSNVLCEQMRCTLERRFQEILTFKHNQAACWMHMGYKGLQIQMIRLHQKMFLNTKQVVMCTFCQPARVFAVHGCQFVEGDESKIQTLTRNALSSDHWSWDEKCNKSIVDKFHAFGKNIQKWYKDSKAQNLDKGHRIVLYQQGEYKVQCASRIK